VDVVAFTVPGLAGALLVGAGVACAMAAALDRPVLVFITLRAFVCRHF